MACDISLEAMTVIAAPEFVTKCLRLNAIPREPCKFFAELTKSLVEKRRADNFSRQDFIQFLMDAKTDDGSALSMKDVADNGIAFFVAGFDTTAHTLAYALYELALNPDKQKKAAEEVYQFLDRYDENTMHEAIATELPYLNAVISETLRKMIPVPRTMRVASQDCELGGYFLPRGNVIKSKRNLITIYRHNCLDSELRNASRPGLLRTTRRVHTGAILTGK